jgi:hypothetical protein
VSETTAYTSPERRFTTDDWCTPKVLADLLGPFELDPSSNERSHVQAAIRCMLGAPADLGDGLTFDWERRSVFCNPPYSDPLPWAHKLAAHDGPWCALLKLDPSTRWWAALMEAGPTVAPFRKRLKFEGDKAMTANFPSVLVYSAWRPSRELAALLWLPTYAAS